MKSKFISLFLMVFSLGIWAQSVDQNWIKTTSYKTPLTDELSLPTDPTPEEAVVQVGYFDGLGRPIQTIAKGQSADDKNIVNHIEYDEYGQQTQEFLPYENDNPNLNYISGAKDQVLNFYNNQYYQNTTNPYSKSLLENSPLNRVLKQAAPGNEWLMGVGHEIKFDYQTNIVTDEVIAYKAEASWNNTWKLYDISLQNSNVFYDPNQLYKNVTWDENNAMGSGEKTEEFKDKEGRVVLKRVWAKVNGESQATKHDTYYVYDQFGNLTYVIPPAVITGGTIDPYSLSGLCYQYKYDERNRLVAKKLPGKQWEYIVYDKLDRVRATGPVLSPFTNLSGNGWLITKYDAFNRPILTAWMPGTVSESTRKSTQDALNLESEISDSKTTNNTTLNGIAYRYTNFSYPISNYHVLTVNYYDDYDYSNAPTNFDTVFGQDIRTNAKGLPTGSWIRVLETSTNYNGNLSYTQYKTDRMSSPIKSKTLYHTGGYTQTESAVNFAGEVGQTITKHKKTTTASDIVITENFTYSDQGRLMTHTHQINNGPIEFLNINSYDKLGQLISKEVGGSGMNTLQTVNYTYNVRGWLTDINDVDEVMDSRNNDLFTFRINYQTPKNNATALFNGNISETYWKTRSDDQKRMYKYDYDGLNRLENASFENLNQNIVNTYNETLTYDKNGNITSLFRTGGYENPLGALTIDNLNYQYDPNSKNQLKKVVDLSNSQQGFKDDSNGTLAGDTNDDYLYDSNGNMTKDENKNITSIVYNHLNLPTKIIFGTGSTSSNITYTYDATGVKLKKIVTTTSTVSTTEYLNGFQYNNNILQFFPTSEGYVNHTFDTVESKSYFNYVYNYTDHLGNIRLSYTWDEEIQEINILEENHYYPFGLKHESYNETKKAYDGTELISLINGGSIKRPIVVQVPNSGYQYQYQGQERQDELNLNWDSFKWRNYDYAIGRFMCIDPLADEYNYQSPYNFAENRVVDGFELEGLEWVDTDNGWVYEGYSYGDNQYGPQQYDMGFAPEGSKSAASWVSYDAPIPYASDAAVLNIGGPFGTIDRFVANRSGMVELPYSGTEQTGASTSGTYVIDGYTVYGYYNRNDVAGGVEDQWGTPLNISNMINSIVEYNDEGLTNHIIQIGDMKSPTNGRTNLSATNTHHGNNGAFDIRLLGTDGSYIGYYNDNRFSISNTQRFVNALGNNGFTKFRVYSKVAVKLKAKGSIRISSDPKDHKDHYHIDMD